MDSKPVKRWKMDPSQALRLADVHDGVTVRQMISSNPKHARRCISSGILFDYEAVEFLREVERYENQESEIIRREFAIRRQGPISGSAAEAFEWGVDQMLEQEEVPAWSESDGPSGLAYDPLFPFDKDHDDYGF